MRELVKHLANRPIAISVKGLDTLVSNLSNDLYLEQLNLAEKLCKKDKLSCLHRILRQFPIFTLLLTSLVSCVTEHAYNSVEKDKST